MFVCSLISSFGYSSIFSFSSLNSPPPTQLKLPLLSYFVNPTHYYLQCFSTLSTSKIINEYLSKAVLLSCKTDDYTNFLRVHLTRLIAYAESTDVVLQREVAEKIANEAVKPIRQVRMRSPLSFVFLLLNHFIIHARPPAYLLSHYTYIYINFPFYLFMLIDFLFFLLNVLCTFQVQIVEYGGISLLVPLTKSSDPEVTIFLTLILTCIS